MANATLERPRTLDQLFAEAANTAGAFSFAADGGAVVEAAAPQEGQPPRGKVSMLARSAGGIVHWYWGLIVHDFAGMKHAPKIPVDYAHDDDEAIGYVDQFVADSAGLRLAGELIAFRNDDKAAEVLFKGAAGIPYASSIDWTGLARIEEVPAGMTADANGQTFQGPCLVVREWTLAGVAVCMYGADPDATSEFKKRGAGSANVSRFRKEGSMSTDTQGAPSPDVAAIRKQAAADASAELKKFTDRFGATDGVAFFTAGTPWADALDATVTKQAAAIADLQTKLTAAEAKLSATKLGEETGVSGNDADKAKGGKSAFASAFRVNNSKQPAAAQ
jgi:hypothetical protein